MLTLVVGLCTLSYEEVLLGVKRADRGNTDVVKRLQNCLTCWSKNKCNTFFLFTLLSPGARLPVLGPFHAGGAFGSCLVAPVWLLFGKKIKKKMNSQLGDIQVVTVVIFVSFLLHWTIF